MDLEEGIKADVGGTELRKDAALGAAEVVIHPRNGAGWFGRVEE